MLGVFETHQEQVGLNPTKQVEQRDAKVQSMRAG